MPASICPYCAYEAPGFVVLYDRHMPDGTPGRTLAPCPECNVVRRPEPDAAVARFALWSEAEILAHIAAAVGDPEKARIEYLAAVGTGTLRMEGEVATDSGWQWLPLPLAEAAYAKWLETPDRLTAGFHFLPDPRWGGHGDRRSQTWGDRRAPRADVERLWPLSQASLPPQTREAVIEAALKRGERPGRNVPWGTFIKRRMQECGAQQGDRGFSNRQIRRIVDQTLQRLEEM
jgi:hypothetical protein